MVLNQATRLTDNTQVRFAALMHDLGKGTTPEKEWPSHHGHEARGIKIIKALCKRFKIPNQYQDLAVLVAKYHLDCHRIQEMKPTTILKKLEALDAYRRPDRFEHFLLACEADARGRSGFEDRDYTQGEFIRSALNATSQIDIQSLVNQGFDGEKLGDEIKAMRIKRLAKIINNE